jgi:hypothetical protein
MIVTSMQLTISSRRDIAVLQKESSALEGEGDVNEREFAPILRTRHVAISPFDVEFGPRCDERAAGSYREWSCLTRRRAYCFSTR